jgi:hypothetical protein
MTPPVPSLIFGFNKRGLKGRLLLFLCRLSVGRPLNELTLQASKVCSDSNGARSDECLTLLYDSLRGSQSLVGGRMAPYLDRARVS